MALLKLDTFRVSAAVLLFFCVSSVTSNQFTPRRILFAKCDYTEDYTAKPMAVFMTCANARGVCEVRAGGTHTLRAVFIPKINSTDVDSYVRWNSWVEVPLPGQIRDACDSSMQCPVEPKSVVRFTYDLGIQSLWPRSEYPVIWSLSDRETERDIVCFKFRINIV
ncbi:MD-2-related lipid-recognition domain [Trinorchestia longiramus]|nr:MD-2-related lipid-recognition domain [Trinorchestia longiramus]